MRPIYALLACSTCLLYRAVTAQESSIVIGDGQPDNNGIVQVPDPTPADSPPGPTPADQDPEQGDGEDNAQELPIDQGPPGDPSNPDDSNEDPSDGSPDGSSDDNPEDDSDNPDASNPEDGDETTPEDDSTDENAPTPTYKAIQNGKDISALVNDQWVPVKPAMLQFAPEAKAVYTGVKVVGNSTTMIVPPTATAITVDGNVFHVAHTNVPIPSELLHTDTPSPSAPAPANASASEIVFPASLNASNSTNGRLVGALVIDPDSQRLHRERDDAKWWREVALILGALAGFLGLLLLLSLLSHCCRRRRTTTVRKTSTERDPATGLLVTTTETKQQGTLNRQAEEGRGRLSQLIGTGNKGGATGAGTAAALGAAGGSQAGSQGGNAGSSGGSGAAGGSGASGAAGGASGGSATGAGSGAAGSSGVVAGSGGTTTVVSGPAHAAHVEAVPAHDGADSLRTGSEMMDMGSLRGRKKLRGDSRSPF